MNLELGNGQWLEEFLRIMLEKAYISLSRLLEIWVLMTLPVKIWRNVRGSLVEKTYVVCIREYLNHHQQPVGRNRNVYNIADESSGGNEEHAIRK